MYKSKSQEKEKYKIKILQKYVATNNVIVKPDQV